MKRRKLRIAWSVAWGIVAVLFVAMWVRSYWRSDLVGLSTSKLTYFVSEERGEFQIGKALNPYAFPIAWHIEFNKIVDYRIPPLSEQPDYYGFLGFGFSQRPPHFIYIAFPHAFLVVLALATALAPWLRLLHRFSLRTLLVAVTIVAVVLGLIVWLM
jgi:hypothetical protein